MEVLYHLGNVIGKCLCGVCLNRFNGAFQPQLTSQKIRVFHDHLIYKQIYFTFMIYGFIYPIDLFRESSIYMHVNHS